MTTKARELAEAALIEALMTTAVIGTDLVVVATEPTADAAPLRAGIRGIESLVLPDQETP